MKIVLKIALKCVASRGYDCVPSHYLWVIKGKYPKISLLVCKMPKSLSFSSTVPGPSAPAVTGQLLRRVLRVHGRNPTIPDAGAAPGQRGAGLLYIHGIRNRLNCKRRDKV